MNMYNISKSYTKTEHTIDKQHSQNGDRFSVSYYKCIFLFSLKFSLHNCDVLCRRKAKPYISVLKSWTTTKTAGSNSEVNLNVQWNLGITQDQVTGRICSLHNEVPYYRGSFPYILLIIAGVTNIVCYTEDFNLLYRGSLKQGFTVVNDI